MKLPFIYADLHWSESSSIVRKQGKKYTVRLEHLIDTMNLIEQHATDAGSDTIILLGDAFDKATLTAQEITALQEVRFNPNLKHIFLVGNHEISKKSLTESTAHIFNLIPNCKVIDTPCLIGEGDCEICFLPYISETDRKPLEEYFGKKPSNRYRLILSHNDIKGIQMGSFISQSGFDIIDINDSCDLFLNGHLHNGARITSKIINIGNICGQNFSEDASKYLHTYLTFDLQTKKLEAWENIYAFNFYKLDWSEETNIDKMKQILNNLRNNAVVTISAKEQYTDDIQNIVDNMSNIVASRILNVIEKEKSEQSEEIITLNHIDAFRDYVLSNIGNNDIIREELQEILQ